MDLILLPLPRYCSVSETQCLLPDSYQINVLDSAITPFTVKRLEDALRPFSTRRDGAAFQIELNIDAASAHAQGYHLMIGQDRIRIAGDDTVGVFYGVLTLIQIIQQYQQDLPCVEIHDFPDFPARGVMLDISRDKVPTMETLYELVDMLANWKVNQLQLYVEHTFAYQNHKVVWQNASPVTAEEMRALDGYCRERFIELVPNQNSFGHMHRWLIHEPYKHLAEAPEGFWTPSGEFRRVPYSLSPSVPDVFDLLNELYDELLPNFSSGYFNVGCDETWDVGQGKSKELVEKQGKGRVYLDFLLKIYEMVKAREHTMMFWGDIINQYPDLVPEVPKDAIALEWQYEDINTFPEKTKLYAESGIPFYVCPGTSSWVSIGGRTQNCMANIRAAVESGLANGAIGVLNTDWGDRGHWQPLPISYLGLAYGAAASWCYVQNREIDLPSVLDEFAFRDENRVMGQLVYDLGNAYLQPEVTTFNSSLMYWLYHLTIEEMVGSERFRNGAKSGKELFDDLGRLKGALQKTSEYIHQVMVKLDRSDMQRADADLIKQEFRTVAAMLHLPIYDALRQLGEVVEKADLRARMDEIEQAYRANWLARNRLGGLEDSVATFGTMRRRNEG